MRSGGWLWCVNPVTMCDRIWWIVQEGPGSNRVTVLFAWMLRSAQTAMEFFKLPTNRMVELGSQVEI